MKNDAEESPVVQARNRVGELRQKYAGFPINSPEGAELLEAMQNYFRLTVMEYLSELE